MRFLSRVRCRTSTIRVRGRSRSSPGGDPDRWECAGALELIEPSDVELIGLVDLSHHQFRLTGVDQFGHAARGLDFVDDPIPIANGLDRHRGAGLTSVEKLLECPALMCDPLFTEDAAIGLD